MRNRHRSNLRRLGYSTRLHDLGEALRRHPELRAPGRTVYRAELPWSGPAAADDPIAARLRQEERQ
jgi:hypothetical protein